MNKILFIRSARVDTDSRLQKYIAAILESDLEYEVLFWNRGLEPVVNNAENVFEYHKSAGHGRRFKNAISILMWNFKIFLEIYSRRRSLGAVHAVDLDTGFASVFACRIFGVPMIYDIYDCYSDSRALKGQLKIISDALERLIVRLASLVLIADEARLQQHGFVNVPANLMVIENIPRKDIAISRWTALPKSTLLRLGYVGNLEANNRGLEDIIALVREQSSLELVIAGLGALSRQVEIASKNCPRIHFLGSVSHDVGMSMLQTCDLILGLYYLTVPNHKFASPNKYYEHLMLGRPLLTSKGTPPGFKVSDLKTGWAVSDGKDSLLDFFSRRESLKIQFIERGKAGKRVWNRRYSKYYETQILGLYVSKVRDLSTARSQRKV